MNSNSGTNVVLFSLVLRFVYQITKIIINLHSLCRIFTEICIFLKQKLVNKMLKKLIELKPKNIDHLLNSCFKQLFIHKLLEGIDVIRVQYCYGVFLWIFVFFVQRINLITSIIFLYHLYGIYIYIYIWNFP